MTTKPLKQRHGMAVSTEHYLRAILELREERGYARVVDIATRVGVTKGSVSLALSQLAQKGLVKFDAARFPVLTASGRRVAMDVRGRYEVVLGFLIDVLGLTPTRAAAEACRWEHVISHDAADRLLDLLHFCHGDGAQRELVERFQTYRRDEEPAAADGAGAADIGAEHSGAAEAGSQRAGAGDAARTAAKVVPLRAAARRAKRPSAPSSTAGGEVG